MHIAARWRLQAGDLPLVHGVIGDAVQPDLTIAPGLDAGPFDAVVEVLRLPRRPKVDVSGRAAAAARVDPDAHVAFRHPLLDVDDLPVLILVGRVRRHIRMVFHHPVPAGRI